ncbi:hypothetical protein Hanom_Chr06g00553801 [Helianthus anomalus]
MTKSHRLWICWHMFRLPNRGFVGICLDLQFLYTKLQTVSFAFKIDGFCI